MEYQKKGENMEKLKKAVQKSNGKLDEVYIIKIAEIEKLLLKLTDKVKDISETLNDVIEELNENGNITHRAASRLGIEQ